MGSGIEERWGDRMAYTGDKPWHDAGHYVDHYMDSGEALVGANAGWRTLLVPLVARADDGTDYDVETHVATVRSDNNRVLGVVGRSYTPHHNEDVFRSVDDIVGTKEAAIETVGTFGGGSKVWMLVKLDGELRVKMTDDVIEKYLFVATSHDGSIATTYKLTNNRVVCQNTFTIGLMEKARRFLYYKHTKNSELRIEDARVALGFINQQYEVVQSIIDQLAAYEPTDEEVRAVFMKLIPDPKAEDEDDEVNTTRAEVARDRLLDLYETGAGNDLPGVRGTAWAGVNAVTEYVDWDRTIRVPAGRDRAEHRLASIWLGDGDKAKTAAIKEWSKVAGVKTS